MGGSGFRFNKKDFMKSSQIPQGNITQRTKGDREFLKKGVQEEGKITITVRTTCAYFFKAKTVGCRPVTGKGSRGAARFRGEGRW
jgi:hypothetical protein